MRPRAGAKNVSWDCSVGVHYRCGDPTGDQAGALASVYLLSLEEQPGPAAPVAEGFVAPD